MVDTAQSAYYVLTEARDYLRTYLNAAGEVGTINGETIVSGHAAPDVESKDIMVSESRVPPQNQQWVLLGLAGTSERLGLNTSVSRTTYRLTVTTGIRSQTWNTAAATQGVTTEDAGWLRAHLLARAAHSVIQRYLQASAGIYGVTHAGTTTRTQRAKNPDVYEIENRFDVMVRTDNTANS